MSQLYQRLCAMAILELVFTEWDLVQLFGAWKELQKEKAFDRHLTVVAGVFKVTRDGFLYVYYAGDCVLVDDNIQHLCTGRKVFH